MTNPGLTWWPVENGSSIALDGALLRCRDQDGNPVVPVPQAVLDTRRYPAWALVNRPGEVGLAEASEAAVMGVWGRSAVKVADAYQRAVRDLPGDHLPVFFEQAARKLDWGYADKRRAATFFDLARAAEAEHGVPISDRDWLRLHLDFAGLGALSAKAVAGFVKGLADRAEPDVALDSLIRVAVLRAHAGQAPWPQLPRQVSAFAKAAGCDERATHRRLLEQLVGAEALWESPAALWTAWRPMLVQVCAESAVVRGLLLNLRPEPESMDGWWLDLLDECGATAGLFGAVEPEAEPAGGRAEWLARTVWHPQMNATRRRRSRYSSLHAPQLRELIVRMAPALRADGVPVQLDGPDYWAKGVDPNVLETCLAHGVPVADLGPDGGLKLGTWLELRKPDDDLPATASDPRFAPILRSWVEGNDPVRLWTIPALRRFLPEPAEGDVDRHPLDGPGMHTAVNDFGKLRDPSGMPKGWNTLHAVRVLTHALRKGTATDCAAQASGFGTTMSLAGRIEWAVLRAVAPATEPERRERLAAFLEVWAESVFTDPGVRIFHGTSGRDRYFAADEHGLALPTRLTHKDAEPFVAVTYGSPDAEPPSLGPVETVAEVGVGWGTPERLHRVVDLLREHGPVRHDPAAAATFVAGGTGLSRAAAEMALSGMVALDRHREPAHDPLTPEVCTLLGIDAKQADDIYSEVSWPTEDQRLDLFTGVLPDDPAQLWQPGGMVAVAERLAAAWKSQFGGGAPVPEQTYAAVPPRLSSDLPVHRLLSAMAGPDRSEILTRDIDVWLSPRKEFPALHTSDGETVHEFERWLEDLTRVIRWAYAALPEGDPVRAGIPETIRLLRERLAHPGLLLYVNHRDTSLKWVETRFGPLPHTGPVPLPDITFDDGLTVVAHRSDRSWFYFRPSQYGVDPARTAELDDLTPTYWRPGPLTAVRFLIGPDCDRILERVTSGGLAVGAFEADPRASAPEAVADVARHLGLSTAAAGLYLQLMAMPDPTDAHVRAWNHWRPAHHKAAVSEILARGLVIEDKRSGAGRKVFLPGTWQKVTYTSSRYKSSRPVEDWKHHFMRSMSVSSAYHWPARPLPDLFEAARDRVLAGDLPK